MSSKRQVLQIYKALICESKKFPSYNFREYALRKIRDSFRENRKLANENDVKIKMQDAAKQLEIIKRQVVVNQLYSTDKLVIENTK